MTDTWRDMPDDWSPSAVAVDVWRADVSGLDDSVETCLPLLTEQEQARAQRYRVPTSRCEFIAGRALLRTLLGKALGKPPRDVALIFTNRGKPLLAGDDAGGDAGGDIHFNLSHSHGVILLALASGRAVGVDVEKLREKTECERLAARFFSAQESQALLAVPPRHRRRAFFNGWTRKEAFLKATGKGIAFGLDQFDVTLWPTDDARLLATRFDPAEAARWMLVNLEPGEGFAGALAVRGSGLSVRCWDTG